MKRASLLLPLLAAVACASQQRPRPGPAPPPPTGWALGPPPAGWPPGPPPGAPAAPPCAAEGGYDCTPDRAALTLCRGGRAAVVSTCRGARGCTIGTAVDCDHSKALAGDPCEGPKEIACSTDFRALLRCAGGFYQVGEICRNACLATSGRVLCQ